MSSVLQSFDFSNLQNMSVWFAIEYACVTTAMILDLICGVYKAHLQGLATTSTGLKKTATKAGQYYVPLICANCVDVVTATVFRVPVFSSLFAIFLMICEFKSIFENTHTKAEIREASNTMNVVLQNKEDLAKVLAEVLKQMSKEK